jgi:hypothetical protein
MSSDGHLGAGDEAPPSKRARLDSAGAPSRADELRARLQGETLAQQKNMIAVIQAQLLIAQAQAVALRELLIASKRQLISSQP